MVDTTAPQIANIVVKDKLPSVQENCYQKFPLTFLVQKKPEEF